jgi:hypothetical protein
MNRKTVQLAIFGGALIMAVQAHATLYDLMFTQTGGPMDNGITLASGQLDIDVVNQAALSGYLDVTAGPNAGSYTLVPGSGNNGVFQWDNFVDVGSPAAFLDSTAGLLWVGQGGQMNMWYNQTDQSWNGQTEPAGSYSLWGTPPVYNPEAYGTATLTLSPTPVPEPTTMLAGALLLLPFGASTFRIVRRSRRA